MRIVDNIEAQINDSQAGSLFFVTDFATSGNDVFVSRLLSEFVEKQLLYRLSKGIYYKPVVTKFGILMPEVDDIVKSIARRDNAKILPTGATAQFLLGFSTQMPMNYVYLTSGSARKVTIGNKVITFKRCVPKNFEYKNEKLAVLIQALKQMGRDRITEEDKRLIKGIIADEQIQVTLDDDLKNAPVWIKKLISNLKTTTKIILLP